MERNSKHMAGAVKKSAYIPPHWVNLAAGLALLVIGLRRWFNPPRPSVGGFRSGSAKLLPPIGFVFLMQGCFHYSIHKFGIVVHFLWIPVRIIKWEKVYAAEYIYEWHMDAKSNYKSKGQGIMVTLRGCPVYCAEFDSMTYFQWRHPWGAHFIRFTPWKRKHYVQVFQQYYPNLRFQVGCDTSWLTEEK